MNNACHLLCLFAYLILSSKFAIAAPNVASVSGAITKTIVPATESNPKYAVVSAGVSAEAVYFGQIASVTSNTISFESSSDTSEVTVNPFVAGVFNSAVRSPILTPALSGAGVGSIAINYSGTGFSTAPELVIDFPTSGDDKQLQLQALTDLDKYRLLVLPVQVQGTMPHLESLSLEVLT